MSEMLNSLVRSETPGSKVTGTGSLAAPAWFLEGSLGAAGEATVIPIRRSPFRVGRRSECSLTLAARTVSGVHAELTLENGLLWLRDLGSTNGTYVNGQRVTAPCELRPDDLVQFAEVALRVRNESSERLSRTMAENVFDQAMGLVQFDRLMRERIVTPHYQPIVILASREVIGYEVLGRSSLPGLDTPKAMFQVAAKLNLEVQLSNMLRYEGVRQSEAFVTPPHLFVNTHPAELAAPEELTESLRVLRTATPDQPLTLEIHEAAVADPAALARLQSALVDLRIKLAFDDFGAGQARLVELTSARPDYLKFDYRLIRKIDTASPAQQKMLGSLVGMALDLGIEPLAEGVETAEEAETCRQLGFILAQGFYFGRPAPAISY